MYISEICIKRPVFATVLSLLIILIGLLGYTKLEVREFPNIDPPIVNVQTIFVGASPEIIESEVTNILEENISGIEGIKTLRSQSSQGSSNITIEFELSVDLDIAANDVRDRVGRARLNLPDDAEEPIVTKAEADAEPILYIAVSSDSHNRLEVSYFADIFVKEKLQTVKGVSQALILGERRYAMRIEPDFEKMSAYGVNINDIESALVRQNVEFPSGIIEGLTREFTVLTKTDLKSVEEFENLIIRKSDNYILRLGEFAKVHLGAESERFLARFKGKEAVGIGIVKQSNANSIEVSNLIKKEIPAIQNSLPDGMELKVAYDSSVFINSSVDAVYTTIAEALILVVLIILFFLRSFRSVIIPIVAIPVSLIGTFSIMLALDFSINTLTLLSLVLAIGLVVDDAIVMMENIFRNVEEGLEPMQAALKGSKQIGFAIIAMTITLAAVFIPIGFIEGETGKLFTEFAWTLAMAVIVSGFVALTLSPMMCSRLFKKEEKKESELYLRIENFLDSVNNKYKNLLIFALGNVAKVIGILITVVLFGLGIMTQIQSELAPTEDRGVIIGIFFGQEGSSLEYTSKYAQQIEEIYKKTPEIIEYFVIVGRPTVSRGISFALLKDWKDRDRSQMEIVGSLFPDFFAIPGIMAFPINIPSLGGGGPTSKPLSFVVQSNLSYEALNKVSNQFVNEMQDKYPWLSDIETDLKLNQPRIEITIDRDKAASLGIDVTNIGRTIQTLIGGQKVTNFKFGNKQYDVIIQMDRFDRLEPSVIENIYVRSDNGEMIKLSAIINVIEKVAPLELSHYDRLRSVTIDANIQGNKSLGEAVDAVNEIASRILNSEEFKYEFTDQAEQLLESAASTNLTFFLALLFIYLVLSAQFESFKDPFIILLTVPLSITGALLALYLTGGTLNIYSRIGLVTLIGLITKNGILIVEFTNQLMDEGKRTYDAVIEASMLRLRPILMTTAATILGAVPLALADGPGGIARNNIGWVVVGGLFFGTMFTIFVIPSVTYILKKNDKRQIPD